MPPSLAPPHAPWPLPQVRRIALWRPLRWLALGWQDIRRVPALSLIQGMVLALGSALLWSLGHNRFGLLVGCLTGFLVIGPVVATSFYAISRALERGEVADWGLVRRTWVQWRAGSHGLWSHDYWCLVQFGLLLALAGTGWVVVSAALITLLSPEPVATVHDFVQHVVLAPEGQLFHLWLSLGSLLAAPIFASSVVAMPLLLERRVTLAQAVLCSWCVVLQNPIAMALWAGCIVLLTLLGLALWTLGLALVLPWLGHASWHAYRELVDASAFLERDAAGAATSP